MCRPVSYLISQLPWAGADRAAAPGRRGVVDITILPHAARISGRQHVPVAEIHASASLQHVPIALPQVLVTGIHVPIVVVVDIWVHIVVVWIHVVVTVGVHIVAIATRVQVPTIWVEIIVLIHVIATGILVAEAIVVLLTRNNHSVRISLFSWQDYSCFSRESLTLALTLTLLLLIVKTANKKYRNKQKLWIQFPYTSHQCNLFLCRSHSHHSSSFDHQVKLFLIHSKIHFSG